MSEGLVKRPYQSPVREQAAAETRQAILRAASDLFLERGFARTTTKAVAERAGITERMIFLHFGSKAALLAASIRAAVRDHDGGTPLLERDEWRAALGAQDAHQIFELLASAVRQLYERAARLLAVGEGAARDDPLLEEERQRGHAATRADLLQVARAMKRANALRPGISAKRAADLIFALAANEAVYLRLIDECNWSAGQYEDAIRRMLVGALAP
jgi:AcrR family transcriptional regulator